MPLSATDLSVYYPFLPGETREPAILNILDAHILVRPPAGDNIGCPCGDNVVITLGSITASTVTFLVTIGEYEHISTATAAIYTDPSTACGSENWVLVKQIPGTPDLRTITGVWRLHPSCLTIIQQPPLFRVVPYGNISIAGTGTSYAIKTLTDGSMLSIHNGYNISVSRTGNTVTLLAASGAGRGSYSYLPFSEFSGKTITQGRGLRSINGVTGDIQLLSYGASVHINTVESDGTITIGIGSAV